MSSQGDVQGASRHRVVIAAQGDEDAKSIASAIEEQGAERVDVQHEGAGLFPIAAFGAIVVGWMSIAGFVVWLKNWAKTRGEKGVLLRHTADGDVAVQEINIPYGQVILVTKDGQALIYKDADPEKLSDLVTKFTGGLVPTGGTPMTPKEVEDAGGAAPAGGSGGAEAGAEASSERGDGTPA